MKHQIMKGAISTLLFSIEATRRSVIITKFLRYFVLFVHFSFVRLNVSRILKSQMANVASKILFSQMNSPMNVEHASCTELRTTNWTRKWPETISDFNWIEKCTEASSENYRSPECTLLWSAREAGDANVFPHILHGDASAVRLCCRICAERSALTRKVLPQIGQMWLGFWFRTLCFRTCKFKYFLLNNLPQIVHGTFNFGIPEWRNSMWLSKFFFSFTFLPQISHWYSDDVVPWLWICRS